MVIARRGSVSPAAPSDSVLELFPQAGRVVPDAEERSERIGKALAARVAHDSPPAGDPVDHAAPPGH